MKYHTDWSFVLEVVKDLKLPFEKLVNLFEQMIFELSELKEYETARAFLRQAPVLIALRRSDPDRVLKLEHMLQRSVFDPKEVYANSTKELRRSIIAEEIRAEISSVPPSRLLSLIMQALKWQQHNGLLPKSANYDLFRGAAPTIIEEQNAFPTRNDKVIKV